MRLLRPDERVGSVDDRTTELVGNFDICQDGYANTNYDKVVHPLSGNPSRWAKQAKLDWQIEKVQAGYKDAGGNWVPSERHKILVRSDTGRPLAMVGRRYREVQPTDVLGFFARISKSYGFTLRLAGEAMHGRRIFALAECPQVADLGGGDRIANYLMLVTHNDGTGATRCFFTSIRFWCMNQLPMMLNDSRANGGVARQTHVGVFNPAAMDIQLKLINNQWDAFAESLRRMRAVTVSKRTMLTYFARVFHRLDDEGQYFPEDKLLLKVVDSYRNGEGQDGIRGTVFGLLQGVTRYVDHDANYRNPSSAVGAAWLGRGRQIKALAYREAVRLTAWTGLGGGMDGVLA